MNEQLATTGPSVLSAEYAAGLFDGEGCVSFYKTKDYYNPVLTIAMTHREVLGECAARWGGTVHAYPQKSTNKTMYHWRMFGKKAVGFADDILPFLIVKREEMLIVRPVLGTVRNVADKRWAKTCLTHRRALDHIGGKGERAIEDNWAVPA